MFGKLPWTQVQHQALLATAGSWWDGWPRQCLSGRDGDLGLHGAGRLPADPSLAASAGLLAFLFRFSQASIPFTDKEP